MSRHSVSTRQQPAAFIRAPGRAPGPVLVSRIDAPFPWIQLPTQLVAIADSPDKGVKDNPRFPDPHGAIRGLAIAGLTPREIEIRIGQLIHASLNGRSTAMATEIVRHIDALCAYPDDRRSPEERCVLRRLAEHWRRLAWLAVDSESERHLIPGFALPCCQPVI